MSDQHYETNMSNVKGESIVLKVERKAPIQETNILAGASKQQEVIEILADIIADQIIQARNRRDSK